jgi:hypothetical protein
MEVFADNHVSDLSVRCSAQSSKTQTLMGCVSWAIAEDPGPGMWVMAAKDESKQFVRDRVGPTFEACRPVRDQMMTAESLEFTFASMPFYFVGAGSPSKLQSKPIRWLICDEVRNYPPGALDTVLKRTRSFWNSRRVIVSTPDMEDDAVDRAYKAGDQRVYHIACPKCSQLQPLKWDQLKWTTDETTKPGGVWDLDALAEMERETGRRVWTVLQMRLHPGVASMRKAAQERAMYKGGEQFASLTYVTPRGPWYGSSWKGDEAKSGGILANIGIHMFDLLLWVYGPVNGARLDTYSDTAATGLLSHESGTTVSWSLAVDGSKPSRVLSDASGACDLSDGFKDAHTKVYAETLAGRGCGIADARPAVELVHMLRMKRKAAP